MATDEGLEHFRKAYPGIEMSKEDVFYYVYGLLHAPWYREKYADNLAKELPRIPCVPGVDRFRAFCQAGHDLANLHLNYESIKPYHENRGWPRQKGMIATKIEFLESFYGKHPEKYDIQSAEPL